LFQKGHIVPNERKRKESRREKGKRGEKKQSNHHLSAWSHQSTPPAVKPTENELRRMTIWGHEILEETDDSFAEDFVDDPAPSSAS
jgi:hypothetical protein